jgi:hypothetical protein
MRVRLSTREFVAALVMMLSLCAGIFAQSDADKKSEDYQNLQRAFMMSTLKSDIKQVDDAPQRCFLRVQVMDFIFARRVRGYYDTARNFGTDCLDDIAQNPNQFSDAMADEWRTNVAALLKRNLSDADLRADGRDILAEEIDLSDLSNLDMVKNSNAVAAKVLAKLSRGEFDFDLGAIIERLREVNPAAAYLVMSAALNSASIGENLEDVADRFLYLGDYYLDPETSIDLKSRYLRFAMTLADRTLRQPGNFALFKVAREILRPCLPFFRQILPGQQSRAVILYATLNAKSNAAEIEADEAFERIRASKNKLAQTVSEAEGAKSKNIKNSLLKSAGRMAVREKRFRLAVDLTMQLDTYHPSLVSYRAQFLTADVLNAALAEDDTESALYAVRKVEGFLERGRGLVKIADKAAELADKQSAIDRLFEAVQNLDKADNSSLKARAMLAAVPVALRIDKAKAFDIAADAIKVINRLPSPSVDDKPGTEARLKYTREVLQFISEDLNRAVYLLAQENLALADPTAQGIQQKELRLVAQIALEAHRPYTIPAESEKPLRILKPVYPPEIRN